jgi:ribonuclease D
MQEKALRIENKRLRPAEVQVLKALYDWRDKVNAIRWISLRPLEVCQSMRSLLDGSLLSFFVCVQYARLADESTLFVCPDRTLMRIAQMTPQTFNSLQVCLNVYHEG